MGKNETVFPNKIREIRKAKGVTLEELAELTGISPSYLSRMEGGKRNVSIQNLSLVAAALKVQARDLVPDASVQSPVSDDEKAMIDELVRQPPPRQDSAAEAEANATFGEPARFPRRRLPVYGQAVGGDDGRFILNGQRLADVLCPPALENVRDAYAVFIHGSSMEPRYYAGETAWVHPHLPVRSGDFVVAQIQNDDPGEPPLGFVKKFISKNGRELVLEQFTPPEGEDHLMRFPADRVISVHKIVLSGLS